MTMYLSRFTGNQIPTKTNRRKTFDNLVTFESQSIIIGAFGKNIHGGILVK